MRCMRARRRDLCSGGGGESGGGGGGGVPMGGGESDAEAPAPSALIVAEVRGCYLPMPPAPVARPCHLLLSPAPVACPCHLPPPQVTLRLHTGRTHQLRAQVSHPRPAPARPQPAFSLAPARLQPAFSLAPARLQPGPSPPSARLQPAFSPLRAVPMADSPRPLASHACLPVWQLGFVGHPVLGDEMYGSRPLEELRELCRLDTAPEGPLPSLPVAWLPERPFALHSWKLRFAGRAAEPEDPGASSYCRSSGDGHGGSCRQVTHAYEVQPPWTV